MKVKLIYFLVIVLKLALPVKAWDKDSAFIKLEYNGEVDKPYSTITFYLPGSIDTTFDWPNYKVEVTKSQFQQIASCITKTEASLTYHGPQDGVSFTIKCNDSTKEFVEPRMKSIAEIFHNVRQIFKDSPKRPIVFRVLDNLTARLQIPNN
jgi:hypothetical protein